eukprot:scaffold141825_cov31-Attheya_sp.AAC.1
MSVNDKQHDSFISTSKPSAKKKDDKKKSTKLKTESKDNAGERKDVVLVHEAQNAFTLHKPEECHLEVDSAASGVDSLSIARALVGAIEEEDEEDEDGEDDE